MAVLVTGGGGYIGSHMVWALLDAGEDVIVIDDLSTGSRVAVAPAAEFHKGDIADEALLRGVVARRDVSAVIHFAGSIVVPESISDPLKYYLNNTARSRTLIAGCVDAGIEHFIFSSTAAVYGMGDGGPVAEDAPLNPISPYGTSKLMTEWILRDTAASHGLRYVALRYFNVAGADLAGRAGQSTPSATHLIKVASQVALGQRPCLEIFGRDYDTPDGTCVRDYIHVSDLVGAHLDALRYLRDGGSSDVFNCGYGRGYSVLDVIAAVERACGYEIAVRDAPRRPGDPPSLIAEVDKIRTLLGWRPVHDELDRIAASALAWERRIMTDASA